MQEEGRVGEKWMRALWVEWREKQRCDGGWSGLPEGKVCPCELQSGLQVAAGP